MGSGDLIVTVLAGLVGFAVIWFLMSLIGSKFSTGGAPDQASGKPDWAEILEVSPNATAEEIRSAYWRKIQEYQPERLNALGPELRRLAEQRLREINSAFEAAERRFTGG
jgi:DnaJ-domain-containing protein 1